MKEFFIKYANANIIINAIGYIAIYIFWCFCHPEALSYQEQFQMFLFDSEYLLNRLAMPGGMADYIGEFVVQFFFIISLGAVFLTLLFIALQQLTWRLTHKWGAADSYYPLSFVPVVYMMGTMCNPDVMISLIVALTAILATALLYTTIKSTKLRLASVVIILPLSFWLFGYVTAVLPLLFAFNEWRSKQPAKEIAKTFCISLVVALLIVGGMYLAAGLFHRSIDAILTGFNFFRFDDQTPSSQHECIAVITLFPALLSLIPTVKPAEKWAPVIISALVLLGGALHLTKQFDKSMWRMIKYDYLVRTLHWDSIIGMAEKTPSPTPYDAACVNLALGMKGQLGERMFEFPQFGTEGLIMPFSSNHFATLAQSEIFYQLAMVNEAQRFFFEAQAAIPNHYESARVYRRLAETNLINSHYGVAQRYLLRLKRTLFYSSWAESRLKMIENKELFNKQNEYYNLRKLAGKTDMLFSSNLMNQTLARLYYQNKSNTLAQEYALAYAVLDKNIKFFNEILNHDAAHWKKYVMPRHWQEAYLLATIAQDKRDLPVTNEAMDDFRSFFNAYSNNPNDPMLSVGRLKTSAWSFILGTK